MTHAHSIFAGLLGVAPILSSALFASSLAAGQLTLEFSFNGQTTSIVSSGQPLAQGGFHHVGSLALPSGDAVYDIVTGAPGAELVSGTFVVTSELAAAATVDLRLAQQLDAPISHAIWRRSLGGQLPFGGSIASLPGVLMHEVLADGSASPGLLPPGYAASGSIGPFLDLNHVAVQGPSVQQSLGQRWRFQLSPGASVVLNGVVRVGTYDFNSDGQVDGADLGALLAMWGKPGASDFNLDGVTDGADLALLLAAW